METKIMEISGAWKIGCLDTQVKYIFIEMKIYQICVCTYLMSKPIKKTPTAYLYL